MIDKIKKISLRDILGIFKFLIVLLPSLLYRAVLRIKNKELWLICEREDMARDNGVAFFEYMQSEHPEIKTYYAIDKKTNDYQYVKKYNKSIIQWASIKHYFYYMCSTNNLSSHKEGNPNQTLFTVLHLYLNLYNNRIFLQHGITKDDAPMYYYKNTKFKMFICGAKPEYDYIIKKFGYPKNSVKYTGFARYDRLMSGKADEKVIAFIPTWRRWINKNNIESSSYKKNILAFLNNEELKKYLKKEDKVIIFYPHASAQQYFNEEEISNPNVKLCKKKDVLISKLITRASMLITDYSSLFFDFAYLNKPIIYYQPDYKEYREKHDLKEGYYNYKKDTFGPVVNNVAQLIEKIKNGGSPEEYKKKRDKFFGYNDTENCHRIFKSIIDLDLISNGKDNA